MSSLQDLIPVVNKLQDIITTTQLADIDLPILAVVGSQSCGKSSVLENIVGKDFLPRGTGIVTRRPLVLQLINIEDEEGRVGAGTGAGTGATTTSTDFYSSSAPGSGDEITGQRKYDRHHPQIPNGHFSYSTDDVVSVNLEDHIRNMGNGASKFNLREWGEFIHVPNKRFYDFHDIRREIEHETMRIAGQNKGISRIPINLKIYSPNVLNLTLVDLPGLTKIPIGDQPTDIEKQTRNLILEYISNPNCIILAVSPANVDLVNSESLKLARQVDPMGRRTVGILTKLDLMDQGTNALDILKGNVYPLKLGFIGIVNRSQQDISENKPLDESLNSEQKFFLNHPAYKSMASKCGTKYLSVTLNKILMAHIRERLPDIKAKLNTLRGQTEQELASYGDEMFSEAEGEARGAKVLTLMTKFAQAFISSIEGTSSSSTFSDISTKELCGGARIYFIYNEIFGSQLAAINPTHNLSILDIRTAIRNSTGPRPSLFVPELAFDLLVKPQIKLLQDPSRHCVELVYEELMKIVHNVCSSSNIGPELTRYPKLQSKLIEVVSDLLRERLGPTIKYVESLIEIHKAYINTNHPNFVGAAKAMSIVVAERQKQKQMESDSKLRLASERILSKNLPEGNVDKEEVESDEHNDINQEINSVDDVIPKHKRGKSIKESTPIINSNNPDSYLNYFLGKDPIVHQQHLQTQAQLHPIPFKYPVPQEPVLQFNTNYIPSHQNDYISSPHSIQEQFTTKMNISDSIDDGSFTSDEAINELTEREQLECELIRRLIISYFGIVREMIQDQVPKSIMCLLVNYIKQHIQNRLVVKLYNDTLFDELLKEDEAIQAEREKCIELLKTYKEASRIISDVV